MLGALQSYWDAFDPKAQSFVSWVPGLYAEALAAAESEMHWLAAVLPGQAMKLATGLLEILFLRTDKSFRMRMSAALAQGMSVNVPNLVHVLQFADFENLPHVSSPCSNV